MVAGGALAWAEAVVGLSGRGRRTMIAPQRGHALATVAEAGRTHGSWLEGSDGAAEMGLVVIGGRRRWAVASLEETLPGASKP
jgi:hypothetical protein